MRLRNYIRSVYAITDDAGMTKIGVAQSPERRLIECQVGNPLPLRLHGSVRVRNASVVEQRCHQELKEFNSHGEWFKIDGQTALDCIRRHAKIEARKPLSAHWKVEPLGLRYKSG